MNLAAEGGEDEEEEDKDEGFMEIHVIMLQGRGLLNIRGYLYNCSTVTAFTDPKYIKNIRTADRRMTVNCNAGTIKTHRVGDYGKVRAWYIPKGIANIFLMHEL